MLIEKANKIKKKGYTILEHQNNYTRLLFARKHRKCFTTFLYTYVYNNRTLFIFLSSFARIIIIIILIIIFLYFTRTNSQFLCLCIYGLECGCPLFAAHNKHIRAHETALQQTHTKSLFNLLTIKIPLKKYI